MYGPAGWTHTAGIPKLGAKLKPVRLGKLDKERGDRRPKYDKANQASARMHGVR